MRKLLLPFLAVVLLAAVGTAAGTAKPAGAASATVKITHTGYVPTSVSVSIGDTVVFTNSDTVAHTVDFKTTTGMNCSAAVPLVLQAGQSASCTFSSAGTYDFSDPANKAKAFHGSVVVAKAPAIRLSVTPGAVVYGRKVTLAGTLASQQAGQALKILAQQCGASGSNPSATVTTTSGGSFSYQAQPLMQTAYTVKFKSSTSNAATVKVHPRLRLGKVAPHRYALHVFAAESFAGKYATFQRYRLALKRWVTVKRVLLKANASGVAPTVVTSAKFRSRIKARQRVRVTLGQKQVGACYLPGKSNTIRS